jgi:CPA2 family monovalent cation:H+ antiporter-2
VTLTDVSQGEAVAVAARQISPRLDIVVRGAEEESHLRLREAGASEVVHGEFEVGMEFVRHTLHRFGVPSQEVQALLARRRRDYHVES